MMGQSGGRSSEHPAGRGAVARSTPRQRNLVDPPPGEERVRLEEPVENSLERVWLGLVVFLAASGWVVGLAFVGAYLALLVW